MIKKKLPIFLLFALLHIHCLAQIKYEKGYYVNNNNERFDGQERYMSTDLVEEMDKLKTGSIQIMEKFNQMEHRLDYVDDLLFQIKKNTKKIINLSKHIEAMD